MVRWKSKGQLQDSNQIDQMLLHARLLKSVTISVNSEVSQFEKWYKVKRQKVWCKPDWNCLKCELEDRRASRGQTKQHQLCG